jgi:hypothetical protein
MIKLCRESNKVSKEKTDLNRNNFLLFPFFVGLAMIVYAFYRTYPLTTIGVHDLIFSQISSFYWFGFSLLIVSMFIMAYIVKNVYLKYLLTLGIVFTWFSLTYFYLMIPTPDSEYFRGLSEYFFKTNSLDPSQLNHSYYQWPSFFILAKVATSISGLPLATYEFLLYTIIGFLLTSALFIYASRRYPSSGILVVAGFFISITYFINYQAVPFSLGLGLLFILFMLEDRYNNSSIVLILIFYACLLTTHLFVPLFFALYLLVRSIIDKKKRTFYRNLFLISLVTYLIVQLTIAKFSFDPLIINITSAPMEKYSSIASGSLASSSEGFISSLSQFFSRAVTIFSIGLCATGFALILIRRKSTIVDKTILVTGLLYLALGEVLNTLGWRALAIAFIPISLGIGALSQIKIRKHIVVIFAILLTIAVFIPLHQSFNESVFQTKQGYYADNFFINHYKFSPSHLVIADLSSESYLYPQLNNYQNIPQFLAQDDNPHALLYSHKLGMEIGNITIDEFVGGNGNNLLYNDGNYRVFIRY